MFIESVFIECFGSLCNVEYFFDKGVNVIEGQNESGKSTLVAFIKFIFYGLSAKVGDEAISEKSRFTNWNTGISSGSLILNYENKRYRIERRLLPLQKAIGKESINIINLDTSEECFKGKCPGEVFFGIDADVYTQTAYVGQSKGGMIDDRTMTKAIENMLFSGNEAINTQTALKKIDEARTYLLYKNKKGVKIYTLENELKSLNENLAIAKENSIAISKKNKSLTELTQKLEEQRNNLNVLSDKLKRYEAKRQYEQFDLLQNKKDEYLKVIDEESAVTEGYVFEGFLPDDTYIAQLRSIEADINLAMSEIKQYEEHYKTDVSFDELEPAVKEILDLKESCGGKSEILKTVSETNRKIRTSVKTATFFIVFTLLWAVFAVICITVYYDKTMFGLSIGQISSILFVIAFLMFVGGVISIIRLFRLNKQKKAFLRSFSADTENQLMQNIERCDAVYEKFLLDKSRRNNTINEYDKKKKALENKYNDAKALLRKWNRDFNSKEDIEKTAVDAIRAVGMIRMMSIKAGKSEAEYKAIELSLRNVDKKSLQSALEDTEYVGEVDESQIDEIRRELGFYEKAQEALSGRIRSLEIEVATLSASNCDPAEIVEKIEKIQDYKQLLYDKYEAYVLAYESISKASNNLRSSISPMLSQFSSEIMKAVTDQKYQNLGIDNSLAIKYRENDKSITRDIEFLSEGTRDVAYVALRLSLAKLFCTKLILPVIFDETFCSLDDNRLESMFKLLGKFAENGQIIYLTCKSRDREIMKSVGDFKYIFI